MNWYTRKDGTEVGKQGRFKVLEILDRPHGGFCCFVFDKGKVVASDGYHSKYLQSRSKARTWGIMKAKELSIL